MAFLNVMLWLGYAVMLACGNPPDDYGGLMFGLMFVVIGLMWFFIQVMEMRHKWRVLNKIMREIDA